MVMETTSTIRINTTMESGRIIKNTDLAILPSDQGALIMENGLETRPLEEET